jgi:hypothetical protein
MFTFSEVKNFLVNNRLLLPTRQKAPAFAQNLAKHLIGKYNFRNERILGTGCGKGDFLALF